MQPASNITKTYDPFLKLKEYEEAQIPTAASPKLKPKTEAQKEDELLSSPVVKEFNPNLSPKTLSLTQKLDAMINIIDDLMIAPADDQKPVLVEWEPHAEKAVHDKDKEDKVFVKWSKDAANKSIENLQNLEKDYLNLSKLEQQKDKNKDEEQEADVDTNQDKERSDDI